jgi:ABC-type polysaccharide/polyol phosphate transport system ATPase subunit
MRDVDVRFERVGKDYRLSSGVENQMFSALDDVSLDVHRGESVGIVGRNGAGKSTMLKLLAGITSPTRGRIMIAGRIAALIEIGSGFHPELTGRENVFLSGAILGMRRREIAKKLDAIIEFAGVQKFVDTPVKWYSSGMYVRLGFAIAAHLEPDILLIDEVLAVGDAEFQAKCLQRIRGLKRDGVTTILISHDLSAVERLCDRAVLLDKGRVISDGAPAEVIADYHRQISPASAATTAGNLHAVRPALAVTNLSFVDPENPDTLTVRTGGPLAVTLRFATSERVDDLFFEVAFCSTDWKTRFATLQTTGTPALVSVEPPGGTVEFLCPALSLQPGAYYVAASARDAGTAQAINWFEGNSTLYVVADGPVMAGPVHIPHTWRLAQLHTADVSYRRTASLA